MRIGEAVKQVWIDITLVTAIKDIVDSNRRVTVHDVCDVTGYSYGFVQRVLTDEIHMRKKSARGWIPRLLTDDHKIRRVNMSRKFLNRYRQEGDEFLTLSLIRQFCSRRL